MNTTMNTTMNSSRTAIRRGFTAFTAATAFFAVAACGAEVSPPSQDIGGTQQQKKEPNTPQSPRTSVPRSAFGDEFGNASPEQSGGDHDPIDRTKDWH